MTYCVDEILEVVNTFQISTEAYHKHPIRYNEQKHNVL